MLHLLPAERQRALLRALASCVAPGGALVLSALLVAAGRRWPTPLLEQPWALRHPAAPFWLALGLVLLPPLLMGLVLLAGRYEGVDERLMHEIDDEISIGDYVLSGGELAAMVLIDCIVRQLPGGLGDAESASQDSFVNGLLDCPHYTRPEDYAGQKVPPVLLSGNHADIGRWRLKQALGRTWQRRPDLLAKRVLSDEERRLLEEFKQELSGV